MRPVSPSTTKRPLPLDSATSSGRPELDASRTALDSSSTIAGCAAEIGRSVGARERLGVEHTGAADAAAEQRDQRRAIRALARAEQVYGQPAIDEHAHRARQREHVLDAIEPSDRDHDHAVARNAHLALEPRAVALARIEETVIDPAAQAADPFAAEQTHEPQLILGARRQHACAQARRWSSRPPLNMRASARWPTGFQRIDASSRARRPPPAKRSMVAAVKTRA